MKLGDWARGAGWSVQKAQETSGGYHLFKPDKAFQVTFTWEHEAWYTADRMAISDYAAEQLREAKKCFEEACAELSRKLKEQRSAETD